jgi:hypothetical protein
MGKLKQSLQRFMSGRNGTDKLNMCILIIGVIISIVAAILKSPMATLVLTTISYVLMFWAIFRCFSRNTYKRYQENRKFLQFVDRIKDRDHRYFDCPKCHQSVRVPRHKGKIAITCPKCKEKFIRKT